MPSTSKSRTVSSDDREDPAAAAAVMERTCPDAQARRFLMQQLLRSAALAEQAGPRSWAVTLFADGFRLNVGQVEAFTWFNRVAGLFMLGAVPAGVHTVGDIIPCSLRSMPQPQWAFYGSAGELQRLQRRLAPGHASFVATAAVTSRGKPRRSPYARYHSPGLYRYALACTGALKSRRR
jgi:hypothetical protein